VPRVVPRWIRRPATRRTARAKRPRETWRAGDQGRKPASSVRGVWIGCGSCFLQKHLQPEILMRLRGELRCKSGLLLTHDQLALLQGLLDRPRGVARSRRDLARAALPYIKPFRPHLPSYWSLYAASENLPLIWVARRRVGNRIQFRILKRGRAILEGRAGPIRLRGIGSWAPRSRPADIM
jgi:hypothetical protein